MSKQVYQLEGQQLRLVRELARQAQAAATVAEARRAAEAVEVLVKDWLTPDTGLVPVEADD